MFFNQIYGVIPELHDYSTNFQRIQIKVIVGIQNNFIAEIHLEKRVWLKKNELLITLQKFCNDYVAQKI